MSVAGDTRTEPHARLVIRTDRIEGLIPGGEDFAGRGVEIAAGGLVPDRQMIALEADGGGQGGALAHAAGRRQRPASASEGPAWRTPAQAAIIH
jgi:hypothetical protein